MRQCGWPRGFNFCFTRPGNIFHNIPWDLFYFVNLNGRNMYVQNPVL